MPLVEEHLICNCHDCGAEFLVKKQSASEKQNLRCACGNELKKAYHVPVLTIYGTAPEINGLNIEIVKKLEHQKRLRFN